MKIIFVTLSHEDQTSLSFFFLLSACNVCVREGKTVVCRCCGHRPYCSHSIARTSCRTQPHTRTRGHAPAYIENIRTHAAAHLWSHQHKSKSARMRAVTRTKSKPLRTFWIHRGRVRPGGAVPVGVRGAVRGRPELVHGGRFGGEVRANRHRTGVGRQDKGAFLVCLCPVCCRCVCVYLFVCVASYSVVSVCMNSCMVGELAGKYGPSATEQGLDGLRTKASRPN